MMRRIAKAIATLKRPYGSEQSRAEQKESCPSVIRSRGSEVATTTTAAVAVGLRE